MTAVILLVLAAIVFSSGISGCLTFIVGSILLLWAGSMLGGFGVVLAFIGIVVLAGFSIFGSK